MNDTEICNLALGEVGDTYAISDIDESTPQAAICKRFFASTRDALLRSHQWSFARKSETLSQLAAAPLFGWDYAYQLPADFLRLVRFNDQELMQIEGEYEIESGKVLLTDDATAEIVYIKQIVDAATFDSLFVEAFALKLASRICIKLSKDDGLQERIFARYRAAIGEAKRVDANESRPRRMWEYEESDLVNARSF